MVQKVIKYGNSHAIVIAADLAATYGIPTTVLRAGHIVDARQWSDPKGRSLEDLEYCRGGWVCRHDLARACLHAVPHPPPKLRLFHIVGASPGYESFRVREAEEALGFRIESRFEAALG